MVSRKDLRPYSQIQGSKVFSPEGRWQNELRSTMVIDQFDGTNFPGTYTSAVSTDGQAIEAAVRGTLVGDAIAFLVNWKDNFSSVTAWTGLILGHADVQVIHTLWHLASTPEDQEAAWQAITAGADFFTRAD